MARYKIWDKQEDIYTLGRDKNGKAHWTAQEYINEKAPWAARPDVKVIVGGGAVNGTVFMEFEATREMYQRMGVDFSACETDEDVLAAIETFEATPAEVAPSAEERIAAALEYQNLLNM